MTTATALGMHVHLGQTARNVSVCLPEDMPFTAASLAAIAHQLDRFTLSGSAAFGYVAGLGAHVSVFVEEGATPALLDEIRNTEISVPAVGGATDLVFTHVDKDLDAAALDPNQVVTAAQLDEFFGRPEVKKVTTAHAAEYRKVSARNGCLYVHATRRSAQAAVYAQQWRELVSSQYADKGSVSVLVCYDSAGQRTGSAYVFVKPTERVADTGLVLNTEAGFMAGFKHFTVDGSNDFPRACAAISFPELLTEEPVAMLNGLWPRLVPFALVLGVYPDPAKPLTVYLDTDQEAEKALRRQPANQTRLTRHFPPVNLLA